MSTLVATTLQDRASSDQVTIAGLLNPWEIVDLYTLSGEATLDFFHDGWEGTGSAAFITGWEYRVSSNGVYGSSATLSRWNMALYESGVIRNAASSYRNVYQGYGGAISTLAEDKDYYFDTSGILYLIHCGSTASYTVNGYSVFTNLGNASLAAEWSGRHIGRKNSGVLGDYFHNGSQGHSVGTAAASKVQLIANSGTMDGGVMTLERRYVG